MCDNMDSYNIEKIILDANGFEEFNIVQKEALNKGLLKKSMLICSPTASGKTLNAELAAINSILVKRKKVIYTCPLKALASEHYKSFKKKYSKLGIKFTIATGDFDSSSTYLNSFDLIFTTFEKLDSLLRHKATWLSSLGLIIVDEIHTLGSSRGPALEVVISSLRLFNPSLNILGLSATVPNSDELSSWLDAELIVSSFRPVPLKEFVFHDSKLYNNKETIEMKSVNDLQGLVEDTLALNKSCLVFANSRKRTESIANKTASSIRKTLKKPDLRSLNTVAEKIVNVLETPTEQCVNLSNLVRSGVAFHHAGLLLKQREILEDAFRNNQLKCVVATPTLAMGVNVPAHTVIISSLFRHTGYGMEKIMVSEYKQMAGRASRPMYNKEGRSIILASSEMSAEEYIEEFIKGELEPIESQLGIEPVLRTHILSLISSNIIYDLGSLEKFFSNTLYVKQFGSLQEIFDKVQRILKELEEMEFIEINGDVFSATPIGKRIAELYLDPVSASKLISMLSCPIEFTDLTYLYSLVSCYEFKPHFTVPKKDGATIWDNLQENSKKLPINLQLEMYSDPDLSNKYYSSEILEKWITEIPEQTILKENNIQPGLLRGKLMLLDWLAYSALEIVKLVNNPRHITPLNLLRTRLKYGISAELTSLVQLKGIGRVRARKLFNAGIKTATDIKKTELGVLSNIVGSTIAVSLHKQLGQTIPKDYKPTDIVIKQKNLFSY